MTPIGTAFRPSRSIRLARGHAESQNNVYIAWGVGVEWNLGLCEGHDVRLVQLAEHDGLGDAPPFSERGLEPTPRY